jgi:tetratricopeptide (TPR) repeat protein
VDVPTEADKAAAEEVFDQGFGSYQEGDYEKAIEYWEDAYRRDCTAHLLLLNLASAYERIPDKPNAIKALKTYLERVQDDPNQEQLRRRIENLEEQVASEQVVTPVAPPQSEPSKEKLPFQSDEQAPARSKSIAPWIVVGSGGVVTIVGAVLLLDGAKKVSDSNDICPDRQCPQTKEGRDAKTKGNRGRTEMTLGWVSAGVGVAAVAGGLTWHFLGKNRDTQRESSKSLKPVFTHDYAGLVFDGSF